MRSPTDCVVLLAALWLLNGCGGSQNDATGQQSGMAMQDVQDQRELTYEEVVGRLSAANISASGLYDEINALSMYAHTSPHVCGVFKALWDGEPPTGFDPRFLSEPTVRLGLAKMLHQCPEGKNDPRYYEYVISTLEQSPDEDDRMRALIALGAVGRDQDVGRLRSYAMGSSTRMAVGAVGGLSLLDSPAAHEVLKEVAADVNLSPSVRKSAANALEP